MTYDNKKAFPITSICREDLHSIGIDTSTLTDEDMERIAERMADYYIENSFWNDAESIAIDVYKLKQVDM